MAHTRPLTHKLPWNDRKGNFSPFKTTVLVLVSLPALWLVYRAFAVDLGPRPFTEAIHRVGDWTVYLLLITLAVTPTRRLFDWKNLIQVRRILGLSALFYILLHFVFFIIDSKFDLVFVGQEIVFRFYLAVGFVALLGLVVLGITSTDGWVKRLTAMRWNRLHKVVYVLTALGIFHYYMQSKIDVSQPVLMTGFFYWLMGYRALAKRGIKEGFVPLALLSVAAAIGAAATEAIWYAVTSPVPVARIALANLDFSFQIRPAWWVLFIGLAVAVAAELWKRIPHGHASPPGRASATRAG